MRRIVLGVAVLVAFCAVVPAALGSEAQPTVRVLSLSPLKITGSHFRPHTRVRVHVPFRAGEVTKVARVSKAGTFTLAFAGSLPDPCSAPALIRVVGQNGVVAIAKLPLRMCAPAAAP